MAVTCRSPRLLDASFQETARLRPAALSCQLQLTDASAATMTLTRQDPVPAMHDWVELYAARGSLGLYRATALQRNHDRDTTVTLRHAIDTLSDNVWRVRDYDYSGTVAGYLAQLLSYQTHVYWQLGTVEDTGSWKRSGINYTRLSELLWELAGERHGYYFTYDFSTTPWTLNFLALPSAPAAEWRLTRNVHTLQLIRNDEDLCTRLYCTVSTTTATTPQGYTPEELDGRTVPVTDLGTVTVTDSAVHTYDNLEAQAIYGIVEKTADIDAEDVANPAAWAAEFLADRAEPTVQITIDGYELAAATGDSWDAFDLGKMTRCILADSGEILHERVVAITYPDLLGEPEHVTVELANRLAKFTDSLASVQTAASSAKATAKKASRGGGSSTKDMEHWAMIVKKAVESLDGTGLVDLWETGIELDAQTGAKLYSLFQGPGTSSQGVLQVMNNEVKAKASQTTVDDLGTRVSQAEIDIDGSEAAILLKVAKGDVATQLSVECGNVTISGGNLVVDGYITSQGLITAMGNFSGNISATGTISGLHFTGADITMQGYTLTSNLMSLASKTWYVAADGPVSLAHYHDITATENNGVITITQGAAQDTPGTANFNMAATSFYQNAVAAAERTGWTNAIGTVRINNSSSGAGDRTVNLASGDSVTVYAQGKDNSGAAVYTTYGTVTVNAEAVVIDSVNGTQGTTWGTWYIPVTMTATASNGETGSNTINVDARDVYTAGYNAAPVNPTVSQCYVRSFSVSSVSKSGDGYEVVGSVTIRINFSDNTHQDYTYTVRDIA